MGFEATELDYSFYMRNKAHGIISEWQYRRLERAMSEEVEAAQIIQEGLNTVAEAIRGLGETLSAEVRVNLEQHDRHIQAWDGLKLIADAISANTKVVAGVMDPDQA